MKGKRQGWQALAAGLIVFLAHGVSPVSQSGDSRWAVPAMEEILRSGSPRLDRYLPMVSDVTLYSLDCVGPGGAVVKAKLEGCPDGYHAYPRYPVATPVLGTPLFAALDQLAGWTPAWTPGLELLRQRRYGQVFRIVEILIASALVGICAFFVFLTVAEQRGAAWFWTMAFAFGTSAWSTASRAMWSQTMEMALLAAGIYCLLGKRQHVFVAGILFGLAVWNRPLAVIAMLFFAIWLGRNSWRLLAGAAAASVPFVLYCLAVYRMPVQPYFLMGGAYQWDLAVGGRALLGQVFSPARGLLVYSPFVVAAVAGAAVWWRRDRGLVLALAGWFALHAAAISFFRDWTAGFGYGPRYWGDILPGIMVLLGAVTPVRKWVYVLVAWAVLVHGRGALDNQTASWNELWIKKQTNVWDWKGAPFLKGITW
jgi:hypothetical protein